MGKEQRKIRILQRDDGAIFARTPVLEAMPNMYPGTKVIEADGTASIILDKASAKQLNPNSTTARENALIDENASLREQLAQAQGFTDAPEAKVETKAEVASGMEKGETPLPPEDFADLSLPKDPDAPKLEARSTMIRWGTERLIKHAKNLNPSVEIPEDALKETLVDLCVKQQDLYRTN